MPATTSTLRALWGWHPAGLTTTVAIAGLVVALVSCGSDVGARERRASLGAGFELRPGQQVVIEAADIVVIFDQVASDSRCPVDVTCVWAGDAELHLRIEDRSTEESAVITLHTLGGNEYPRRMCALEHTLELERLAPAPRSTRRPQQIDYVATLIVNQPCVMEATHRGPRTGRAPKTSRPMDHVDSFVSFLLA